MEVVRLLHEPVGEPLSSSPTWSGPSYTVFSTRFDIARESGAWRDSSAISESTVSSRQIRIDDLGHEADRESLRPST